MAKNRDLNINSCFIVLCNGIVVSCVMRYYRSVCFSGLAQVYPSFKEETHHRFHQASLPFRGLQLSLTFLVTFGLFLGYVSWKF